MGGINQNVSSIISTTIFMPPGLSFGLFVFMGSHQSSARMIKNHGRSYERIFKSHVLAFTGFGASENFKVKFYILQSETYFDESL
jgi:hypothetical protein